MIAAAKKCGFHSNERALNHAALVIQQKSDSECKFTKMQRKKELKTEKSVLTQDCDRAEYRIAQVILQHSTQILALVAAKECLFKEWPFGPSFQIVFDVTPSAYVSMVLESLALFVQYSSN
jgi:hypothetical protein